MALVINKAYGVGEVGAGDGGVGEVGDGSLTQKGDCARQNNFTKLLWAKIHFMVLTILKFQKLF